MEGVERSTLGLGRGAGLSILTLKGLLRGKGLLGGKLCIHVQYSCTNSDGMCSFLYFSSREGTFRHGWFGGYLGREQM